MSAWSVHAAMSRLLNKCCVWAVCLLPFMVVNALAADVVPRRTELLSMALSGNLPDSSLGDAYFDVLMAVSVPGSVDIDRSVLLHLQGDMERKLGGDVVKATQIKVGRTLQALLDKDLEDLTRAADAGMVDAQTDLAEVYDQGIGVAQNAVLAEKYARLAASQGFPRAQVLLAGILIRSGREDEALTWLGKAAVQNDPPAQFMLAIIMIERRDEQQMGQAIQMMGQAAGVGYPPAQAFLAEAFLDGEFLPKDPQAAGMWAQMVLEKGAGDPVLDARMRDILAAAGGKGGY